MTKSDKKHWIVILVYSSLLLISLLVYLKEPNWRIGGIPWNFLFQTFVPTLGTLFLVIFTAMQMVRKRISQTCGFCSIACLLAVSFICLFVTMPRIAMTWCPYKDRNAELVRADVTKSKLKVICKAVNHFKMDTGRYPTESEGLNVLIGRPAETRDGSVYLWKAENLKDGWGKDFIYELNLESGKPFVIKSLGADGKKGGKDYNADILSTDLIEEAIM